MATMLTMSDPRAASPVACWASIAVEQSGWRWTAGKFSVILRFARPDDAAQMGATLKFKFSIPPAVIDRCQNDYAHGICRRYKTRSRNLHQGGIDYEYPKATCRPPRSLPIR